MQILTLSKDLRIAEPKPLFWDLGRAFRAEIVYCDGLTFDLW